MLFHPPKPNHPTQTPRSHQRLPRHKRLAALAASVCMAVGLMGAHGGCSEPCPAGTTASPLEGGLRACWYDLGNQQWRSINRGELKVKLQGQKRALTARPDSYAFVFIEDPQEVWQGKKQGRFGWWRLHVKPGQWQGYETPRRTKRADMLLRWRLRDQPDALQRAETVQLMASWRHQGKLQFKALISRYQTKDGTILAYLPASLQHKPALSLFPVKISKTSAIAKASVKQRARLLFASIR